jgi:hypothetical protein
MNDTTNPPIKRCTTCKQNKPLDAFYRNRSTRDGLHTQCKICSTPPETLSNHRDRASLPPNSKRCSKCHEVKLLEMFCRSKTGRDGVNPSCKDCQHDRYHERHRDKKLAHYRANEEKMQLEARNRYKLNAIRRRESARLYRQANQDLVRERDRLRSRGNIKRYQAVQVWRKANPGARNIEAHNRRARIRQIGGKLTAQDIAHIAYIQQGHCAYCGRLEQALTIEHIIPTTRKGSSNDPWNICLACPKCNYSKQDKLLEEWVDRWYLR